MSPQSIAHTPPFNISHVVRGGWGQALDVVRGGWGQALDVVRRCEGWDPTRMRAWFYVVVFSQQNAAWLEGTCVRRADEEIEQRNLQRILRGRSEN